MTAENQLQNSTNPAFIGNLQALNPDNANQSLGAMNMLKRDRFELLSAYLDGEVTAAERQQVENWLANDPEIQRLYRRLLNLRQELQAIPVPPAQAVEQTVQQVYQRLDRRSRRRTVVWGGSAIAALFIGALSSVVPHQQFVQIARSPESANTAIEPLMVALNTPVIEIPKAATAAPDKPSHAIESFGHTKDFN